MPTELIIMILPKADFPSFGRVLLSRLTPKERSRPEAKPIQHHLHWHRRPCAGPASFWGGKTAISEMKGTGYRKRFRFRRIRSELRSSFEYLWTLETCAACAGFSYVIRLFPTLPAAANRQNRENQRLKPSYACYFLFYIFEEIRRKPWHIVQHWSES